jgi:hypothetical protein
MKKAILILFALLALGAAQAQAETFMLVVEELCDGSAAGQPLASEEGLMARMFELGHVTFDSGPYRPEMDWGRLEFGEPLSLAREGRAHYLAAIRVQAQTLGSVPAADGPPGRTLAQLQAQARYYLWNAQNDTLLAEGEYTLDNRGREQELPYQTLLFQVGDMVARELVRLSRSPTAKG